MKGTTAVASGMGLILVATALMADTRCDRRTCEEVKAEIREIESRMRAGYSHTQGLRYEERLRQLRECRYRLCR